ncbi:hypothetical protein [Caballeronia sp. EK]|uniref:hypothetical protein n=1 Tax=Caballeronia sp. EK TaxID=2767469 RepID=UPI00210657C7|nr:hypothetical protein [Caballeronia sp. EK]
MSDLPNPPDRGIETSRRRNGECSWRRGAWGVWVNDALDFLAIAFVLGDIARRRGVRWIGGLAFGGLSY